MLEINEDAPVRNLETVRVFAVEISCPAIFLELGPNSVYMSPAKEF